MAGIDGIDGIDGTAGILGVAGTIIHGLGMALPIRTTTEDIMATLAGDMVTIIVAMAIIMARDIIITGIIAHLSIATPRSMEPIMVLNAEVALGLIRKVVRTTLDL